ncbi:hypothetical protein RIF29_09502 [Crotalaria pallida]|uniref:Uncharacterized protein n=1 Tax=Crotalaria pallida TaxID=3830 RepID=A0AAN9IKK5_CROPI
MKPETVALCERNRENRRKQTIPHTCGAKSLPRRRHDLKLDTGNTYGRGPMWQLTHKYMDGSYVNEEAQEKGDKIDEIIRENPNSFSEISSNDPVGVVFGKEHPGYARGMGMGVVPTVAFKHKTTRLNGMNCSSSNACNTPSQPWQQNMEIALKALLNYVTVKEEGRIPEELAGVFATFPQQAPNGESGAPSPTAQGRSSNSSNAQE